MCARRRVVRFVRESPEFFDETSRLVFHTADFMCRGDGCRPWGVVVPETMDSTEEINISPISHRPIALSALSLYFTPVPLKLSLRRIKLERGKIDSNREMRHRRGNFREDSAFEVREREDVNERERELVQGFGDLEFLGLVTVTASTEDELLANVSQMRSAMEGRAMEVRSMNGQQLAAFNCGRLPLALAPASSGKNPLGA